MRKDAREGVRYHVAISYASEDAGFARNLADYLRGRGLEIFFAEFSPERLFGEDMQLELHKIFMTEADRAVVMVSKHYVSKVWPRPLSSRVMYCFPQLCRENSRFAAEALTGRRGGGSRRNVQADRPTDRRSRAVDNVHARRL